MNVKKNIISCKHLIIGAGIAGLNLASRLE